MLNNKNIKYTFIDGIYRIRNEYYDAHNNKIYSLIETKTLNDKILKKLNLS